MPCDAVATVSAQIKREALNEILQSAQGKQALLNWIGQKVGVPATTVGEDATSLQIVCGQYYITLSGGTVQVSTSSQDVELLNNLRDRLAAFVKSLAGILLQERVKRALASRYPVVSDQVAANGARVFTVEV